MQVVSRIWFRETAHPWPISDAKWQKWLPQRYEHVFESVIAATLLVIAIWHDRGASVVSTPVMVVMIAISALIALLPFLLTAVRQLHVNCQKVIDASLPRNGTLIIIGMPSELTTLRAYAEKGMEPEVISRLRFQMSETSWGVFYVLVGLLTYYVVRSKPELWFIGYLLLIILPQLAVALSLFLHFLSPMYYRISPSKIEIIKGQLLNSAVFIKSEIPLEKTSVIARFDSRSMVITDARGRSTEIPLDGIDEPHAFVKGVIGAWANTEIVAKLPNDSLCG